MKPNKSKLAILGLVAHEPASGYDIKKLVEQMLSHFWNESYGQIYPILKQLAAEGLAVRKTQRQKGKPDRQLYSVTPKGVDELREWLLEPVQFQATRNETLLKLFFGYQAPPEESIKHVEHYRDHHLQQLELYTDLERMLKNEEGDGVDLSFWMMTLSHGKYTSRAMIRWADEALEQLEKLAAKKERKARKKRG